MRLIKKILVGCLVVVIAAYFAWALSPLPKRAGIIEDNYFRARETFIQRAAAAGAEVTSHQIKARGPNGEALYVDVGWLGSKTPKKALLHISGTHGVEGFPGSKIQNELLTLPIQLPEDAAVIFIHALNPYGMAHYRRFNESNADLNRNFVFNPENFKGSPEAYRTIEWFLNPEGPPTKIDLFFPKAVYLLVRHGFVTLKQAIAGGQYDYPKGIYFGGNKLEESSLWLKNWVTTNLSSVGKLYVVEIHTGLGPSAKDVLFWPLPDSNPKTQALEQAIGENLESDAPEEGVGFVTPGDLQNSIPTLLPNTETAWILQEFGAYGPVLTLHALRNENSYHFYGAGAVDHWSKRALLEIFCPGDRDWQATVVNRGVEFAYKFLPLLRQ